MPKTMHATTTHRSKPMSAPFHRLATAATIAVGALAGTREHALRLADG